MGNILIKRSIIRLQITHKLSLNDNMIELLINIKDNLTEKQEYAFQFIDAILFLLFLIAVLYLFIFAVYSKKKALYSYPKANKKYRYAILFPAYMEDDVIIDSVRSFFKQDYPRELYDVIVISDQMCEETICKLKDLSAKVIQISDTLSTKIYALQQAVEYIECEQLSYEMVVVLDADNIVNTNFLEKINDAFYSGCLAIQTHRVAKNRDTNTAVLDAVSEEINNSIFRKGHTRLGFSSGLSGSGMAFEYELFKKTIQGSDQIGEDKYMERKLLLENIYIEYLEDVYTYDEKVRGKKEFYNQRRRWLATQFSNLFSGISQLPGAILRGKWDYCDKLFQWMMPPRILLLGFALLIACFLSIINILQSIKWWGLLLFIGITFSLAVPDYLVDKQFKKAITSLPVLFLLMFFNLFRLRGGNKKFIHTKHSIRNENSH